MLVNMAVVDHVRPLALGGSSTAENLRISHHGCNGMKSAKPLPEVEKMRAGNEFRDRIVGWAFAVVRGEVDGVEYRPETVQ
jgi:5-methylcytosine-specific restriction endonuclease McrA